MGNIRKLGSEIFSEFMASVGEFVNSTFGMKWGVEINTWILHGTDKKSYIAQRI